MILALDAMDRESQGKSQTLEQKQIWKNGLTYPILCIGSGLLFREQVNTSFNHPSSGRGNI
jgi:hypothetical protein